MSKLKHVEGIGLIDLSEVTLIGEIEYEEAYFKLIIDGNRTCYQGEDVRDNLIKAIEEHDKPLLEVGERGRGLSLADKEELRHCEFLKQKEALKAEVDTIYQARVNDDALRQKVLRGRQGSAD